ncbi:MAG: indolepyruvate ferredoxin oxidoreductase subunit alpha, partial [Deltaproteobacteria bacterium]|nr:indolepyruvate ferredoxin oxidoreductase subunit alpha [Deltaproteobacteria bacterium]
HLYVEWSVNEKVSLEVALAASLSGVRAIAAMKQNGLNVALDSLSNINLSGVNKGLVLVVCDDPGGISSTNEQDSRHVAKILDLPLLEPASFQEAKDMTTWAFDLSERISNVCILRSVTRISHARGNVVLGNLPERKNRAYFDTSRAYATISRGPLFHRGLHQNLKELAAIFEASPFNHYNGPENPELLLITSGSGWLYARESVTKLSLENTVGILKLGTTWPLPRALVSRHLLRTERVLIVEEIDAFLEGNVKELAAELQQGRPWTFYGKASGPFDPYGELNPDIVVNAITRILDIPYSLRDVAYQERCREISQEFIPPRDLQFCAGCPHRATFWAIKDALKLDHRACVVAGDIGCYSMALLPTGFSQIKTIHAMGSGIGVASGLGKFGLFGFSQPVLTVCGDSTFFHAVIPGLVNAVHTQADLVLVVLDNSGTAMTGFQPHPGIAQSATGEQVTKVDIEALCLALNVQVQVTDPYDMVGTTKKLLELLVQGGKPRVLICRRECALIRAKTDESAYPVRVDPKKCIGEACGCNRYCARVFRCPGLIWDAEIQRAKIDEAVCSGCGVCVHVCPQSAIIREAIQ